MRKWVLMHDECIHERLTKFIGPTNYCIAPDSVCSLFRSKSDSIIFHSILVCYLFDTILLLCNCKFLSLILFVGDLCLINPYYLNTYANYNKFEYKYCEIDIWKKISVLYCLRKIIFSHLNTFFINFKFKNKIKIILFLHIYFRYTTFFCKQQNLNQIEEHLIHI